MQSVPFPTSDTPKNVVRPLSVACVIAGALALLGNLWVNRYFYHDDALISLRYAINLAQIGDLSWNPGDRVEGYTNFLHIVLVSGLIELGIPPIPATRVVNAFGAALLVASVVAGLRVAAPQPKGQVPRAVAVAAVAAAPPVAIWILGGLEAILAAGFTAAGIAALLPAVIGRRHGDWAPVLAASVAFALAYLTRPDAVVVTFAAGVGILAFGAAPLPRRVVQFVLTGALPVAVVAAHMAWRLHYYGDVAPNTFHAKVGIPLSDRIDGTFVYMAKAWVYLLPVVPLAGLAVLAAIATRSPVPWRAVAFLTLCILSHVLYVVWSGGDHMPGARVLLTLLAPAAILFACAAAGLPGNMRNGVALVALAACVLVAVEHRGHPMNPAAYVGTVVGQHIDAAWPDDALVALSTAGSTPYHAPAKRYIDMLGLNDREIGRRQDVPMRLPRQAMPGHAKGDGASILRRRPDYVILGPANGVTIDDPWFLSDLELAEDPAFRSCYERRDVELPRRPDWPAGPSPFEGPLPFTFYERTCAASDR